MAVAPSSGSDRLIAFGFRNSTMKGICHSVDTGIIFDGDTLTQLPSTTPVTHPDSLYGVRDPSIIRFNGKFYMAATKALIADYLGTSTVIQLHSSTDLRTWTWERDIPTGVAGTYRCWAPELFLDDDGNIYLYYAVSTQAVAIGSVTQFDIYAMRATDTTLANWTSATKMSGISASTTSGAPAQVIDAQVTNVNGTYHMFAKNEDVSGKRIFQATASNALGPWTIVNTDVLQLSGVSTEGPELVKMYDGSWRLYYDKHVLNQLAFKKSTDLVNWSAEFAMSYRYTDLRHLGFLWATKAEHDTLLSSSSVTYVGAGTVASTNDASIDLTYPTGWLPGDLMVAVGVSRSPVRTFEGQDGWSATTYARNTSTGGSSIWVVRKVAGENEDTTATFTIGGTALAGADVVGSILAFRGADDDTVFGTTYSSATTTGTTVGPITGVTTEAGGAALVISAMSDDYNATGPVAPTNFTTAFTGESITGTDASIAAFYRLTSTATATGSITVTHNPTAASLRTGVQITIPPARPQIINDTFTRTSTTSPGVSDTGQTWRADQGTWGTDGTQLYSVNHVDNDVATIDLRTLTQDITTTVTVGAATTGAYAALLARWTRMTGSRPSSGWWYFLEIAEDGSAIVARPGAALASVAAGTFAAGTHLMRLTTNEENDGTRVRGYIDGTLYFDVFDNTLTRPMGMRVGIRQGGATGLRYTSYTANVAIPQGVTGTGITSGGAFGAGTLTPGATSLAGTGVGTGAAFGAGTVSGTAPTQTLTGTGIASGEALGAGALTAGAVSLTGTGIGTGEALGAAVVSAGPVTLAGTGIASGEAVGSGAVTSVATLVGAGVATGQALGAGAVTSTITLQGTGIPTSEASGAGTVTSVVTGAGSGIASGEAVGAGAVTPGATSLAGAGIGSGEAIGAGAVSGGATSLVGTGIPTGEALGAATVTPGAVTLTGVAVGSGEAIGVGVVTAGATTLAGTGIGSGEAVGVGIVAAGGGALSGAGIATGEALGVGAITAGAAPLAGAGISTGEAFGVGTVTSVVTVGGTGISTGEALGAGTVTAGATGLIGAGIPTGEALGAGSALVGGAGLAGVGIGTGEAFGVGAVTAGPVTVTGTGIASSEAFGAGVVSTGGALLAGTGIASDETVGQGVVTPGATTLTGAGITSLTNLGDGAVTPRAVTITGTGIGTAEALGAATVTPGAATLGGVGIPSAAAFGAGTASTAGSTGEYYPHIPATAVLTTYIGTAVLANAPPRTAVLASQEG